MMNTERLTGTTRTDLVLALEELLGSAGSREIAEKLHDAMPHGHDGRDCWVEIPSDDSDFWAAVQQLDSISLWEAYRLANRRRASVSVSICDGSDLKNGRTERSLRVFPSLINGFIHCRQGLVADPVYIGTEFAKSVRVERS